MDVNKYLINLYLLNDCDLRKNIIEMYESKNLPPMFENFIYMILDTNPETSYGGIKLLRDLLYLYVPPSVRINHNHDYKESIDKMKVCIDLYDTDECAEYIDNLSYTNTPTTTPHYTPYTTPTTTINTPYSTSTTTTINTPYNTPTNTTINTPYNTHTNTPYNTPTNTPYNTPTSTPYNQTDTPTNTPYNTPTTTLTPYNTSTPTNTPNNQTYTPTSTPYNTNTPYNQTDTPTNTPYNQTDTPHPVFEIIKDFGPVHPDSKKHIKILGYTY